MRSKKNDEINRNFIKSIMNTSKLFLKKGDLFFKEFNITSVQYNLLIVLFEEKSISQKDIAERLVTSRSDITGLIDRLEKVGYVKREDHLTDRRFKLVALTKKGFDLVNNVKEKYLDKLDETLEVLTIKEKEKVIACNENINLLGK